MASGTPAQRSRAEPDFPLLFEMGPSRARKRIILVPEGILNAPVKTEKAYILVIDDDPLLTSTVKRLLHKAGYFVDTANDGREGIRKAKTGFFHLVLCDIRMPGLDGLMTLRHIRDFQEKAGAGKSGFIVVTAYDAPHTRREAFQLGVSYFLLKPFDAGKFLEAIEHHVTPLVHQTPLEDVKKLNARLKRLVEH